VDGIQDGLDCRSSGYVSFRLGLGDMCGIVGQIGIAVRKVVIRPGYGRVCRSDFIVRAPQRVAYPGRSITAEYSAVAK
jgi:hypothetical protein